MKKRTKIIILSSLGIVIAFIITIFLLLWNAIILLNNPTHEEYPIRGVDISSYQGEIDWDILSSQDIQFAFIKATEGSSFVDPNFNSNFKNAQNTSLRIGAYHFFSYDSSGKTQAENFIANVPKIEKMLPPVVDVEFYGDKEQNPPNKKDVENELNIFLDTLEQHYNTKPIIYATEKSYNMFIAEKYNNYDIWIRNIISFPSLSDGRAWRFWQYTNRARIDGYKGAEKYIDMNVFNGTVEEFLQYVS